VPWGDDDRAGADRARRVDAQRRVPDTVTAEATDLEAIIQAAGQGSRMGLGAKAFVDLAGKTLLERAVATMLEVAACVTVAVPAADLARARRLVGGSRVSVVAGGARRIDTVRGLVDGATRRWLLLHDVVHPFATSNLARRVVARARQTGAAAAALVNVDFLFAADGSQPVKPGERFAIQKPVAFARESALKGFRAAADTGATGDSSVVEILALGGQPVDLVTGHHLNFKLTTPADFALAEWLASVDPGMGAGAPFAWERGG
jgi:2-C-methyl-D-erythritol 4-phosphate cytidylyltransferase